MPTSASFPLFGLRRIKMEIQIQENRHLELKKDKIKVLSCGEAHAVLIAREGNVLFLDKSKSKNSLRPLSELCNRQVTQVACGDQHSIALTQDGQLFTWGQNSNGQLGLGKGEPSILSPQCLKPLSEIPLAQISAGGDHSFALSLSGAVFGWGKNNAGQLGLGDNTDRHDPTSVNCLNLKMTIFISCGEEHTAVLTKGGVVFTFGSGCYGQLGHNSLRDELRPRLVAELWGSKVSQLACGRHHTLAFVGSSKTIYSFGRGEQGQLGNGQRTNQSVPLPVLISAENNQDQIIERIIAGGNHSFALCTSQGAGKGSSKPSPRRDTTTIDDRMIDRWISECDSNKGWEGIKKEISKMFSSASCLNGGFLEKSCDEHYQTSEEQSGLDLSLARLAFEKLAKKDKVFSEHLELKKDKIKVLSCGEAHAVLIAREGNVLFLDKSKSKNSLRPLSELCNRQVTQVACGDQHSIALTQDGQLFTWGQNSNGQLGLGKGEPSILSPQCLKPLSEIPLAQISAGGDHSFALSLSGAVFGWGKNNAGQLGLGDNTDRHDPTSVNCLNLKMTIFISCGEEHTAVLTKGGVVFTFGSGCYGQLGHNSLRDELRPRLVAELWGSKVSQLACGRHHTLAFVGSSKTIYSFGRGEQGQLGNGQRTNQSVPLPVLISAENNQDQIIERIIAGGNHSFALCTSQGAGKGSSKPSPRRDTTTIDDRMIDRWISECDSNKGWEGIKKEISKMFSSASCLNGGFLEKSCDEHYQTSEEQSGLDLSLARLAFEKLAKKDKVFSEVEEVVQHMLLPSLSPSPAGVEGLRVYLILPELLRVLHKLHRGTDLTMAVAAAILRLHPDWLKVLEKHWSRLPGSFLRTVVKMFRLVSATFIHQMVSDKLDHMTSLQKTVQVLQKVYEASCRGHQRISASNFYINKINSLFKSFQDWPARQMYILGTKQIYEENIIHLISTPCVFNFEAKCALMDFKFQRIRWSFPLKLRRTALLEDTFSQLRAANQHDLKGWLEVQYLEELKQTDVNKRDLFLNLFDELSKPDSEMFMYNDTETLVWFPAKPKLQEERYFLFGTLCGLAFHNKIVVHMPFPLAMFKKLVNVKPSLEDLTEFSPFLAKSLQYILDYTDEDVENMDMTFSVIWDDAEVELDPSEKGKIVTNSNKKEFVDAYVDYALNKSVERVFEEFRRGFFKACDRNVVEFFQPEELRGVMVGMEDYDWDKLKQNATYEGEYYSRHPTILTFWEVFEELAPEEKKAFLLFVTSYDRVPILGMDQIKMRVQVLFNSTQDHIPESLTCHALLMLPMYQSKERLKAKLTDALHHKRGFWVE